MELRNRVMSLVLGAVAQAALAHGEQPAQPQQPTQAQAQVQPHAHAAAQPAPQTRPAVAAATTTTTTTTAAAQQPARSATAKASPGAASVPAAQRAGDMLIRSADAGPTQPHPQAQARPVRAEDDEGRKPRTSTTMLLTALAVMCAIVLRRIGNGPR